MNATSEFPGEYPLVTFALLTFNQEKYIRQAVESALNQDYPNLEIIVSDDCSSDKTIDVAARVVDFCKGPHKVVIRRTQRNAGTLLHLAEVASMSNGRLIVLAAGDDVSKENRVSTIVRSWKATGAWGFCSRFDRINDSGKVIEASVWAKILNTNNFSNFFFVKDGPVRIVHGATSAYNLDLFKYLSVAANDYVLSEDGVMSVLLNALGKKIIHIDDSLVMYREHEKSLTNSVHDKRLSLKAIKHNELNILRFAFAQANRCKFFVKMFNGLGQLSSRPMNINYIEYEYRRQLNIFTWYGKSIPSRLVAIMNNSISRSWAIPRVLGETPFVLIKWIKSSLCS